jgi:hypothetical protein
LGQFTRWKQQAQFLNFLVRSQQVAFYAVSKKLQGALPFFAGSHPLPLLLQTLGNPHGQSGTVHWLDRHSHPKTL